MKLPSPDILYLILRQIHYYMASAAGAPTLTRIIEVEILIIETVLSAMFWQVVRVYRHDVQEEPAVDVLLTALPLRVYQPASIDVQVITGAGYRRGVRLDDFIHVGVAAELFRRSKVDWKQRCLWVDDVDIAIERYHVQQIIPFQDRRGIASRSNESLRRPRLVVEPIDHGSIV